MSADGIKLWLEQTGQLSLVVCQFRHDIIGYEDWRKLIIRESLSMQPCRQPHSEIITGKKEFSSFQTVLH